MKKTFYTVSVLVLCYTALSFSTNQGDDSWKVPDKYQQLKNPVPADEASIASGKELFEYFCVDCHGNDGQGNKKKTARFDNPPTDLSAITCQQQSDGALLYKIYNGHENMPAFKRRLPGNQSVKEGGFGKTRIPGDIINYIRSLAKK